MSLEQLGNFLAKRGQAGDADKALGYCERVVVIRERLADANPEDRSLMLDLAIARYNTGEGLSATGHLAEARPHYLASAKLFEELIATNPQRVEIAIQLTECYETLGKVFGGPPEQAGREWLEKAWHRLDEMKAGGWTMNRDAQDRYERLTLALGK